MLLRALATHFDHTITLVSNTTGRLSMLWSVYGVGQFGIGPYSKSKDRMAYNRWKGMLQRCYDDKYLENKPSYNDCFVCDEWFNFQNFAKWFYENYPQDGNDYHLDKDLKVIRNKECSPSMCMFVSLSVNAFTTNCQRSRGKTMIGSIFEKQYGNFKAACQNPFTGKQENLGRYKTDKEAHLAWRRRKATHCKSLALHQKDNDVYLALMRWSDALTNFDVYKDGFSL
ncbi:putative DNA-binding domain protein [Vibrio phage 466E53-1]|nr:putative DNA-binding domain protein [Vibrio phage 466E53-1]